MGDTLGRRERHGRRFTTAILPWCMRWPCGCWAIPAQRRTSCRKCSCSCGAIPAAFDSSRGNLGAWLGVITRNRAIDGLRKRRPETDIADVVVSVEPDMAGEAERARAMEKVRGALGSMPGAQRSALEMAYFEGLTHTEIAAKTGEPLGTIKTRIRSRIAGVAKGL